MQKAESRLAEAQWQFDVCNGCRYCEGYCAVFPAMERRVIFTEGDVAYLANLCHDCRACYQACMYAPPHEFAIDITTLLSRERVASYERFAWPQVLVRAFSAGPAAVAGLTVLGSALFVLVALLSGGGARFRTAGSEANSFYHVVPFALLVTPALLVSAFIGVVFLVGLARFWTSSGGSIGDMLDLRVWWSVLRDVAMLRYQGGGGADCYYPEAHHPSDSRRRLHQATMYGFVLALASTTLAAIFQDVLKQPPPYPLLHPVVILGTLGGVGMVIGSTGLIGLKRRSAPLAADREVALDYAFLLALDLAALSGLVLLMVRSTPFMGSILAVHLGTLVALYLTAPYGKFVHLVYRMGALLKFEGEERQQ